MTRSDWISLIVWAAGVAYVAGLWILEAAK